MGCVLFVLNSCYLWCFLGYYTRGRDMERWVECLGGIWETAWSNGVGVAVELAAAGVQQTLIEFCLRFLQHTKLNLFPPAFPQFSLCNALFFLLETHCNNALFSNSHIFYLFPHCHHLRHLHLQYQIAYNYQISFNIFISHQDNIIINNKTHSKVGATQTRKIGLHRLRSSH